MNPPPETLLEGCIAAVTEAGQHAFRNRHRRGDVLQEFKHDVKLALDVECQQIATRVILSRFPTHAVLGEEDREPAGDTPGTVYQWIIDPIDGTVNFRHGMCFWCCSVAVRRGAEVLAGAVFAPQLDRLFTATVTGPALCNGQPIRVSETARLSEAIVMTGLDKNVSPEIPPLHFFGRISAASRKARVLGSAAMDLCQVAAGEGDAYFESGIFIWDVAAAGLIVRRAGGTTEVLREYGGHRMAYVATNGPIHGELRAVLREAGI